MTQHSRQQTVIPSQRIYTERRDLARPHDSKSKHTKHCIRAWHWGISKTKQIQELPAILSVLHPSSLPYFCLHLRNLSTVVTKLLNLSCHSYFSFVSPTGWTGHFDFEETRDDTQRNVCIHDKKKRETKRAPLFVFPWPIRRLISTWGLSTNNDALFPGIDPNRALCDAVTDNS